MEDELLIQSRRRERNMSYIDQYVLHLIRTAGQPPTPWRAMHPRWRRRVEQVLIDIILQHAALYGLPPSQRRLDREYE